MQSGTETLRSCKSGDEHFKKCPIRVLRMVAEITGVRHPLHGALVARSISVALISALYGVKDADSEKVMEELFKTETRCWKNYSMVAISVTI
jgi:hypothetical protein